MYQRIMVPLDGSRFGEYAIPFAMEIADRTGADVDLVHVHVPEADDLAAFTPYQYQHVTRNYRDWDRVELDHEAERLRDLADVLSQHTGLRITSKVIGGRVPEALQDEAARFHADLIVMSTHARTGLARATAGSVADVVVRRATMPVLLVNPGDDAEMPRPPVYRRILVSLDGSAFSSEVIVPAQGFARAHDADMRVVHVVQSAGHAGSVLIGPAGTRIETILARRVAEGILDVADHWGADVIAIATHGRGGLTRMLMGSTASDLIAKTHLPVLLHRPSATTAPATEPARHAVTW
jgi:nucleotide-binding universal stress UspA family protein